MSVIVFTAVFGGLIALLYYWLTKTYSFWEKLNVIGPKPRIFFGNIADNVLNRRFLSLITTEIYNNYPKEKYVGMYIVRRPVLLLRDLDIIKDIFVKNFDSFSFRGVEFSKEGFGANLFHADGDTWNVLRKRFTPMFTSGKMRNMSYLAQDCAETFADYVGIGMNDEGKEINVTGLTSRYTTGVICACAFGLDGKTMTGDYNIFLDYGNRLFNPSWRVLLETVFPGSLKKLNISFFPGDITDFFYNLVDTIIKEREGKPKTRNDFMDIMIEMKEQGRMAGNRVKSTEAVDVEVTDGVIAAQALLFFGAGYETSASTSAYMLYELALNQDVQDKVLEEVDRVFVKYDGKLSYDALSELSYLNMVISETLRKYPIVDPLQREAVVDYKVPGTDLVIPKGTLVFIPNMGIHNNPEHWPNPEIFDPDRFSPENERTRHPMAFQSFGNGPRVCIGARFARMQILYVMVALMRRYRVEPTENTARKMEFRAKRLVLQPKDGIRVFFRRRIHN